MSIATTAPDIMNYLKISGATLNACVIDAATAPALSGAANSQDITVIKLDASSPPLKLSGHCKNLRIESDGGSVQVANGAVLDGVELSGQRLSLSLGDGVKCNNINAEGSCFITLECGNQVEIRNGNFKNSILSYCDFNANGVAFHNCKFEGAHLNPSFKGASINQCSIDSNTRLESADWHLCRITDLKKDGKYVTSGEQIGIEGGNFSLSPMATMAQAGVQGGITVESNSAPIVPRGQDTGRGIV